MLHLVAEVAGALAGTAIAELFAPLPNAWLQIQPGLDRPRLQIHFLEVAAAHRRRGMATLLVDAAEE